MKKVKAIILANDVPFYRGDVIEYVYGAERVSALRELFDVYPLRVTMENIDEVLPDLEAVEVVFSTWGMLDLTEAQLDLLPNLKIIFYAAGSVGGFADAYAARGIRICNAVDANAVPVAEFCLAQILLSCKGAYRNSRLCRAGPWEQSQMPVGRGAYGETVAIIGVGAISRYLLKLLVPFNLRVIAVSDYLTDDIELAMLLGIDELVSIDTAFKEGYAVSNHLPDTPYTQGIFGRTHFESMRDGATFINTGRGAQIDEAAMIEVLRSRPDLTALLDVQHPEPPHAQSELYALTNVQMTSHIAGSSNDEVRRMADYMIDDAKRWLAGETLQYEVELQFVEGRA